MQWETLEPKQQGDHAGLTCLVPKKVSKCLIASIFLISLLSFGSDTSTPLILLGSWVHSKVTAANVPAKRTAERESRPCPAQNGA